MKPELSIIIPCYNCEETLELAVESCLSQGLVNFEVILVDDGSKDKTKDVMSLLKGKHKEVKVFYHEKNKGGGATRNTAVEKAEADIIFCLDSDDALPPFTLLAMLSLLKEKKCDAVGIEKSIKFRGLDTHNIARIDTFGYAGEQIPLESLLQKDGILCPLYSTFMHTKKSFQIIGGYPTEHGFDTQGFAWRFLAHGLVAYGCKGASYLHRIEFKESYYLRESNAGKSNYNWRDIFTENGNLFDSETLSFIESFVCKNFSKDIFLELLKRKTIFRSDVQSYVGKNFVKKETSREKREYIRRDSLLGLNLRVFSKIKRALSTILLK